MRKSRENGCHLPLTDLTVTNGRATAGTARSGALTAELLATCCAWAYRARMPCRSASSCWHAEGLHGYTERLSEVCSEKNIGPAKAAQIKAAIELGNRSAGVPELPVINSPATAAAGAVRDSAGP